VKLIKFYKKNCFLKKFFREISGEKKLRHKRQNLEVPITVKTVEPSSSVYIIVCTHKPHSRKRVKRTADTAQGKIYFQRHTCECGAG
jgi:hypothetical protein